MSCSVRPLLQAVVELRAYAAADVFNDKRRLLVSSSFLRLRASLACLIFCWTCSGDCENQAVSLLEFAPAAGLRAARCFSRSSAWCLAMLLKATDFPERVFDL